MELRPNSLFFQRMLPYFLNFINPLTHLQNETAFQINDHLNDADAYFGLHSLQR